MSKISVLRELSQLRRSSVPRGSKDVSEFADGLLDGDFVSPLTIGAGNLDARYMLVLQDWCSEEYLTKLTSDELMSLKSLGRDDNLPTNRNLKTFLDKYLEVSLSEAYATNVFPYIKPGNLSANIPASLFSQCAANFTVPEIDNVGPQTVICFGVASFNAVRKHFGLKSVKNLDEAARASFSNNGTHFHAVCHPGGLGLANRNRGGVDRNHQDWLRVARSSCRSA